MNVVIEVLIMKSKQKAETIRNLETNFALEDCGKWSALADVMDIDLCGNGYGYACLPLRKSRRGRRQRDILETTTPAPGLSNEECLYLALQCRLSAGNICDVIPREHKRNFLPSSLRTTIVGCRPRI